MTKKTIVDISHDLVVQTTKVYKAFREKKMTSQDVEFFVKKVNAQCREIHKVLKKQKLKKSKTNNSKPRR